MKKAIYILIITMIANVSCFSIDHFSMIYPFDWNINSVEIDKRIEKMNSFHYISDSVLSIPATQFSIQSNKFVFSNLKFNYCMITDKDYILNHDSINLDLTVVLPVFILVPEYYDLNEIDISILQNKKIVISNGLYKEIYSPLDLKVSYFDNNTDYLMMLKTPQWDTFLMGFELYEPYKKFYKQGEILGKMNSPDLYIDIMPYYDMKEILPILVSFK